MAGPLWTKAGKVILATGKAVLCGSCPCGAPPAVCCGATTSGPGTAPTDLFVGLSGTGCVDGTYHTVFRNPAAPFLQQPVCWESAEQSCGGNFFFLCLFCTSPSGQWQLDVITRLSGGFYTGSNSHAVVPAPTSCSPFALSASGLTWLSPNNKCCTMGTTDVTVSP